MQNSVAAQGKCSALHASEHAVLVHKLPWIERLTINIYYKYPEALCAYMDGFSPCLLGQVLPTPRVRGSRMRINPTLVKQFARRVCLVGVPLWRFLIAKGTASVSEGSKHSRSLACRTISYSPVQLRQALLEFASKDSAYKAFLDLHENRNLPKHLQTLLLVLSSNDDPLSIEADSRPVRPHLLCSFSLLWSTFSWRIAVGTLLLTCTTAQLAVWTGAYPIT